MEKELESLQKFYNIIIEFFVNYSFQLIGAVIVFILGIYIANKVSQWVARLCNKHELDLTLTKFVVNIVKFGIIIGRPFIVGNTISVQGVYGVVEEIRLAYTILSTEDGEQITIPNKHIIGEVLVNSFEYRIVESVVGIDYSCNPSDAIETINKVLGSFSKEIAQEPKAQVGIKEFGDFSINLELRYWAYTKSFFDTQYRVNLALYEAFKKEGITIPFPTYNLIKKA